MREWKFYKEIDGCTISKDGLSVRTAEDTYASIPFGLFFGKDDKRIYKFHIKMGKLEMWYWIYYRKIY